ncbi:glyoxylase-like metal-dependent hydrolase (beta-lactamase superfamily II) [Virgibacillus halotolerans]|uniref:MBL fold metallo-hydrolase n=1 Tax=Virgibacillus halotolerans TaxID=1071053 RepID=UPI001961D9E9|nr:MBL fold metallo-hydrolase [Virgibacillus halotolerans]MBM7599495.1 glyoxylase-like metal-dependent hydrolase (beta-lactamase superfamily II) [Virgibacillus halotolerans]
MEENKHHGMKDAMEGQFLPMFSFSSGMGQEVLPDLYCYTNQIVNVCLVGDPEKTDEWVLIDTGMPESVNSIIKVVEDRFGENSKPKAIIQTHGHFDHVGSVVDLVEKWGIPVYAHEAELPFLTGKQSYPEPDGSVEGGLVAKMSPMFPNEPVDLGTNIEALPSDGSIPHMPGWRWLHTPGHAPGHISLFRDEDRALIAGDAFVTVKQESLYKVVTQEEEINGPPRYLTTDWDAARKSVEKLEALKPAVAVTGHGHPMSGDELLDGLERLVREFDHIAIPDYGRFVNRKQ